MLQKSDVDLKKVIADLAYFSLAAGYLVPTETGLRKGILDAHDSLRKYFLNAKFHDFSSQQKGQVYKVIKSARIFHNDNWINTKVSLYRPETKNGDPRIWISELNKFVRALNLLVLIVYKGELYLINASNQEIWSSISNESSILFQFISMVRSSNYSNEEELLTKLRAIGGKGFIASTTNADSGVGDTLEELLGIKRNSNSTPDYKGIELKASRLNNQIGRIKNRHNLFSKVPNWELSNFTNATEIVDRFGYFSGNINLKSLHVTLTNVPNAQGLFLQVSKEEKFVDNLARIDGKDENIVTWLLSSLEQTLSTKHKSTFWVKARSKINNKHEYFNYTEVIATSKPLIENFSELIKSGSIQMDYTFSEKVRTSGTKYVRDHGYLWKINPADFHLLFPQPKVYSLTE